MEKIEAFKASDGSIFENEQEAKDYEAAVELQNKIDAFANKHGYSGMDRTDISDMIMQNINELREILKNENND